MTADGRGATTLVVAPEALGAETHRIEGEAYHHLVRVKRLGAGDALRLVDGAGRARFARLASIGKRDALARLGGEAPSNEPELRVELLVSPPKPERAAWLVEKVTELGVAAIRFLPTERAARAFAPAQLERLRRVAVAAVEQCGRARLPELAAAASLAGALEQLMEGKTPKIALDAAGASPFSGAVLAVGSRAPEKAGRQAIALLVGPEGGWTEEELGRIVTAGAEIWSLGARALRVETAAVVGAGLLLARDAQRAAG